MKWIFLLGVSSVRYRGCPSFLIPVCPSLSDKELHHLSLETFVQSSHLGWCKCPPKFFMHHDSLCIIYISVSDGRRIVLIYGLPWMTFLSLLQWSVYIPLKTISYYVLEYWRYFQDISHIALYSFCSFQFLFSSSWFVFLLDIVNIYWAPIIHQTVYRYFSNIPFAVQNKSMR